MNVRNVETIVTIHCKTCGDIVSLGVPLTFEEATKIVDQFNLDHQHKNFKPTNPTNTNPWII